MKFAGILLLSLASILSLSAGPLFAQGTGKSTLVVDDDKVQCPAAQFTTIQSAVNAAAAGDTIHVCAGVYREQVVIAQRLHLTGDNGAIVMPGPMSANGTDVFSGNALAVAILVQNASNVRIDGFIVDGSNSGLSGCSPILRGILYQNASGRISDNTVRHFTVPSAQGCQSGDGIVAQSAGTLSSSVEIDGNTVYDYQKNGITGNEPGTTLTIHNNVVTGPRAAPLAAPNGIQIGFGATGKITGNTVADNVFAPCAALAGCDAAGAGILVFESDSVIVNNNTVGSDQFGIFVQGGGSQITNNTVFNSLVLDGIALTGDNGQIKNNQISHSDQDAVAVQGNNVAIQGNTITDAVVGILKVAGSTGVSLSGNTFFEALTTFIDPASAKAPKPVPSR